MVTYLGGKYRVGDCFRQMYVIVTKSVVWWLTAVVLSDDNRILDFYFLGAGFFSKTKSGLGPLQCLRL